MFLDAQPKPHMLQGLLFPTHLISYSFTDLLCCDYSQVCLEKNNFSACTLDLSSSKLPFILLTSHG